MKRASFGFINPLSKQDLAVLGMITLAMGAVYLLASELTFRVGFPLDDSWIHQTFARNLAEHGEWSFRLGVPSAGSTSPLWSALLAIGYLLHLGPYIWTYFIGLLVMWGMGMVGEIAARRLVSTYTPRLPWAGIFLILEWHLFWAAMSGMETLLHGLIVTVVLAALMMNSHRYLTLGLLTGLSVWVRPDGLTLLGPLVLAVLLNERDTSTRLRGLLRVALGFGTVFFFYLLFNLLIGGTPMPNTFYAKQAEYTSWQALPITERLGQLSLQLLGGPSFLLLPGIIIWLVKSVKTRSWGGLLALTWVAGYLTIYVSRLPVYQHGRYIMPAMPILFLIGLLAVVEFASSKVFGRYHWFVNTLWVASLGVVSILFVILGARAYAQDVALIEQEMVAPAKWVNANLLPNAVIAAHDIGALGFFDNHELIDMAGLVTPDVIPFIRDEDRLSAYLDEQGVDYLIAFADLYPDMVLGKEEVFVADGSVAEEANWAPMTIYRWK